MPKLLGYVERLNANAWDSFNPAWLSDGRCGGVIKLFSSVRMTDNPFTNIGNLALTSLACEGRVVTDDQTLVILTWYARSNIEYRMAEGDARSAWNDWVHATTATLVMGNMPVQQLALADILARIPVRSGRLSCAPVNLDDVSAIDAAIAMRLYESYAEKLRAKPDPNYPPCSAWNRNLVDGDAVKWSDLSWQQQAPWVAAAELGHMYQPVIVPVRQSIAVDISTDHRALNGLRRWMPDMLPRVWVHLSGIACRTA